MISSQRPYPPSRRQSSPPNEQKQRSRTTGGHHPKSWKQEQSEHCRPPAPTPEVPGQGAHLPELVLPEGRRHDPLLGLCEAHPGVVEVKDGDVILHEDTSNHPHLTVTCLQSAALVGRSQLFFGPGRLVGLAGGLGTGSRAVRLLTFHFSLRHEARRVADRAVGPLLHDLLHLGLRIDLVKLRLVYHHVACVGYAAARRDTPHCAA
mmetsp:Transcript_126026/g.368243  ORF Transcript_126026/g.368243 Transcript_126026/m.368243 type:complete len:206 (+) Transcript_126026:166-783(+)